MLTAEFFVWNHQVPRDRAASLLMLAPDAAEASEFEASDADDAALLALTLAVSMVLRPDDGLQLNSPAGIGGRHSGNPAFR